MVLVINPYCCHRCGTCTAILWALPDAAYCDFYLSDFNAKNKIVMDRIDEAISNCPNNAISIKGDNEASSGC